MADPGRDHPVIAYAEASRVKLLQRESQRTKRLTKAYIAAFTRLKTHIKSLEDEWTSKAEGGRLTQKQFAELTSYKRLLRQIKSEIDRFGGYAGQETEQGAQAAMAQASRDAKAEIQLSLPALPKGTVDKAWRNLPTDAVETLLGMTEPGSPLRKYLDDSLGEAVAAYVGDKLLENVALGKSPKTTAREIARSMGVALSDMERTLRTAQLWGYRNAKHAAWEQNPDLYKGWVWDAKLGPRTCPACISMHGTKHSPDERLDDHYNGRCAPVIITPTYAEILGLDVKIPGDIPPGERVQSGSDWFAKQPEAYQRQVLGGARYNAYKAGKLTMDQNPASGVVGSTKDPVYGPMVVPKSLKGILGDDAKQYYEPRGPKPKEPDPDQLELPLETEIEGPFWEQGSYHPASTQETALIGEISEAKSYDDPSLKDYTSALEANLRDEAMMNQALYDAYGIGPNEASLADWQGLADQLDDQANQLYNKYTKDGIRAYVALKRGAKDSGYMVVGKEQIRVKQGHFSRAAAARMEGELWQEGKEGIREAYGALLKRAGFREGEIDKASFEQRARLLEEVGNKQVSTTRAGKPRQIDEVPPRARVRVTETVDHDVAAISFAAAVDPLATPGLDAYEMMATADQIRTIRLGEGA